MITKDSICWPGVEREISARIAELHLSLETSPPEKVAALQGELAGLRWVALLGDPPPIHQSTAPE